MNYQKRFGMSAIITGLIAIPCAAIAQDAGFRFLATGDVPYSSDQDTAYRRLLKQSENEDFAFLMHVGDIKSQSTPCSDRAFENIRDLFRAYPKPVVYTPGDNEWTDCNLTGGDPVERLDKLRELFFIDRKTLRLDSLNAVSQSRDPKFATYVENYRFTRSGVLFIVAHVVGTGNNLRAGDPAAMTEFTSRNEANLAFLEESFAEAIANDVPGVAVVIHANPDFEEEYDSQGGFNDFRAAMRGFLAEYRRPVVCIHGDSHYFRIDKPFRDDSGRTYMHFTRMEVFGSPRIAGVAVTVDPGDSQVFSYRPWYANDDP